MLDSVAMVDVDVDVEDPRVVQEELENGKDDVVDVAKSGGFGLFGVVQASGPIDCDVGLVVGQLAGCI